MLKWWNGSHEWSMVIDRYNSFKKDRQGEKRRCYPIYKGNVHVFGR